MSEHVWDHRHVDRGRYVLRRDADELIEISVTGVDRLPGLARALTAATAGFYGDAHADHHTGTTRPQIDASGDPLEQLDVFAHDVLGQPDPMALGWLVAWLDANEPAIRRAMQLVDWIGSLVADGGPWVSWPAGDNGNRHGHADASYLLAELRRRFPAPTVAEYDETLGRIVITERPL